jgi:hypothetical protein
VKLNLKVGGQFFNNPKRMFRNLEQSKMTSLLSETGYGHRDIEHILGSIPPSRTPTFQKKILLACDLKVALVAPIYRLLSKKDSVHV